MRKLILFFIHILALIYLNICSCSEIKFGIYSGTFDPPTIAHNHIIRTVIKHLNLEKLYVFVNKNGKKNYKCSARQRVEMLENMLSDIKDKVIIIDQCSDKKYQDYLILKKCIHQPIVCITGYDSYVSRLLIPIEDRIKFDAIAIIPRIDEQGSLVELEKIAFMIPLDQTILKNVSSTEVRKKLAERDFNDISLHPSVLNYIIQNGLYQNHIDKADRYEEAYYAYIGRKFVTIPLPPFDPQASEEAWHENFYKWALYNNQ